jgi:hypothetical protein
VSALCLGKTPGQDGLAALLLLVHRDRLGLARRDARCHAKRAPRGEQSRRLPAKVIVHAKLLAGDLVARIGIRGLDVACLGQHLIDLAVRNQHSAGGVGEHVMAGPHAHAVEDYGNICLKRRQAIPSQRVASPEQ